ncbi:MAG: CHAT domain-containing protein [Candidatus Eisenbacteria bacterium]|nr:CHAT domain-containing protein [Candidatus Eisenbacteria bacterium]
MRFPCGLTFAALLLLWLGSPARDASAAGALPDSLAVLHARMAAGRASDPAIPALAERVVAGRERDRRARPADVADAVEALARVRLGRAENAAADSLFRRALALRRSERRLDSLAIANSMTWVGEAQRVGKQLARAESTATGALEFLSRLAARDTAIEARLRVTLGNVLAERGRSARAVEELSHAVRLVEGRAHPDSLLLGQACRNLGRAFNLLGDHPGARAAYARAAAIQESSLGPHHPELGTTLFLSAMLASTRGDYVEGRRFAERALEIRERALGPTHPGVAIALATLGGALRNLGDPERALPLYERALAIARAAPRPSPFDLSLALNNLGSALLMTGDGARARACLEEARDTREAAFGPGAGSSLWSGTRLAQAMAMTGDLPAAAAEIERALAGVDSTNFGDVAPDLPDAHQVQGAIALATGRRPQALVAYERAHAIADSLFGSSSPHTLDALASRASARAEFGDDAGAWADARRLEDESREVLRLSAQSLAEHEALGLERSRASGLDVMMALATGERGREAGARIELADALVRARLLVLDQLADERRELPASTPALAAAVGALEASRAELARVMVAALREDRALDSTVTRARAQREAAERSLAVLSERFRAGQSRSGAGFAAVAAALPPGGALVSFVRHTSPGAMLYAGPAGDSLRRASQLYSALVLRAGAAAPEILSLGPAAPLEAAVTHWLESCAAPPPAGAELARAAERRCIALGRTVRSLVWDPLAPRLVGASRVFVVPDGVLHAVPFPALPRARGGYLVDDAPVLHRLTAERDLLPWGDSDREGRGLLALGGADFDRGSPGGARDSLRLRFPPLPQTAAEAGQVAALWRQSGAADSAAVTLLVGGEATESAFASRAPGRRVLHVATHGFALGGSPSSPAAGLRGIGAVVSGARRPESQRRAAALPGLALAGANAPAREGAEDGFLTAEEITSLDLTGAEWAVLSACETGLSDPGAPEAVQGLQRAFRRAGVRTVIMSLWAVDDAGTRAWMGYLYRARLLEDRDTAESARAACRQVLRERRAAGLDTHPFHWAAFVAAGDWR